MTTEQCRYMAAAYPILAAEDTCGWADHRHDEPTFSLARAFAVAFQTPDPSDEQVGWFLEDAASVVDDYDPPPAAWVVTEPQLTQESGLDFTLTVNGKPYVIQESGHKEPSHPVSRTSWETWSREADGDED